MNPPPARWHVVFAVLLVACGGLLVLSAHHPGLRLVDFLGFAARARRLGEGQDLVHPLYPIGYPAILALVRPFLGDELLTGRALSIAAGGLAAAATTRAWGPWAGLWLLVQPGFLTFGATEGTDMAAFSLGIAALAARQEERPWLSGLLGGSALMIRYTAIAIVPALLWPTPSGAKATWPRMAAAYGLATAPHWAVSLWTGAPMLPDQSSNLAIGANAVVHGFGLDTLTRVPDGLQRAWPFVASAPAAGVGLLASAVLVLFLRKGAPPRHTLLPPLLWAGAHLLLLSIAFANVRLALPTRLLATLGVAMLLRPFPRVLAAAVVGLGLWTVPPALAVDTAEARLADIVHTLEQLDGPRARAHFLTTDPWVHRNVDGVLESGVPLHEVGGDPRQLDAPTLADFARNRGFGLVIVDTARVQQTYPNLSPLIHDATIGPTVGLVPVARSPGYRVFEVRNR